MDFKFINQKEYLLRLEEFQSLFMTCFNREITKEFLIWRYLKSPIKDIFVNVALYHNRIVANYSVSPCKLRVNGNIEKVGLSMTTMTHPNFRGKGLFTKLAKNLYKKMEEQDYKAVIGFPNSNSHSTFMKNLNWKNIYEIPTAKLELSKFNGINNFSSSNIINDKDFKLDYSLLFYEDNNKIEIFKNLEYLKWRFKDNPINKYNNYVLVRGNKVLSSIIAKRFQLNEIDIVGINSLKDSYTEELLYWIICIGKKHNMKYINMWCQINNKVHLIAEKLGFINCAPIAYFGVRELTKHNTDLSDYRNWNVQMGDSDVY